MICLFSCAISVQCSVAFMVSVVATFSVVRKHRLSSLVFLPNLLMIWCIVIGRTRSTFVASTSVSSVVSISI